MYKLLIVDDESRVREGLKVLVDWDSLGFEIFDAVESAEKALEVIQDNEVDVVLTDIIMYEMTGLDLIEKIISMNENIKTVILSGYGEFQYAQKAIRLGAFDYLTKPVAFQDLNRIFTEIRTVLDNEVELKKQQKEYSTVGREQFLNNLVKGFFKDEMCIRKKMNDIHLAINFDSFCVLRIHITAMSGSKGIQENGTDYLSLKTNVTGILEKSLETVGDNYIFNNDLNEVAVILCNAGHDKIKNVMEALMITIKNKCNCRVHIGVGKEYKNILQAKDSYKEAEKALEYRILKRDSSLLYYEEVVSFFKGMSLVSDEVKETVLSYVLQADESRLTQYVNKILNDLYNAGQTEVNSLYESCVEIFLTINKYISSITGNVRSGSVKNQMTIRSLLDKDSFESMTEFINIYIKESIEIVRNSKDNASGLIIENAKKYIQEHYNEEVTLSKLSEVLYLHPNYLSKLFKEKTGENFISYLSKVRIEAAKQLLRDVSLKIYDISEMTGFCDPKYFRLTFKEIVGITPSEFKQSIK